MHESAVGRLVACERRIRWLASLLVIQMLAIVAMSNGSTVSRAAGPQALRVTELVVVDDKGVERVRISGNVPDAMIRGKRMPRGEPAAGVILYDSTGQERSGYVTFSKSGNVALTLDTRDAQSALFAAGPAGGAALRLWNDGDAIDLRVDEDGSRITGASKGEVVFQQPPIPDPERTTMCRAYREALGKLPDAQVLAACKERMTESACRVCLGLR